MPGNRPHHTDKWHSCVEHVMEQGKDESSASAICTTSLQDAGEAIFEGAESRSAEEMRLLEEFVTAGDASGHPFYGNQYTEAGGAQKYGKDLAAGKLGNKLEHVGEGHVTGRSFPDDRKPATGIQVTINHGRGESTSHAYEKKGNDWMHVHSFQSSERYNSNGDQTFSHTYNFSSKGAGKADPELHAKLEKASKSGNSFYTKLKTLGDVPRELNGMRSLHLLGATSAAKTIMHEGREHLIVPVVALMEGVIHAVNAQTPEFVSADVLTKAAQSWVGKPTCVGHPKKDGKQCSANSPEVLSAHGFGKIRSAVMKGTKLVMETLVDPLRLKALKQDRLLSDLRDGKPVEVSVGAYVTTSRKSSEWNGKPYVGEWLEVGGDHLAFLPGGRGACSLDMGCGAHRAAMHLVTAESIDVLTPARLPLVMFSTLEDVALDERMQKVYQAVNDEFNDPPQPMAYAQQIFDDKVIVRQGDETFAVPYVVTKDGDVSLGKAVKVRQTWVAAAGKMTDCPTCDGTGQVLKDGKQSDCPTCDGEGKVVRAASMKTLLGSRHSKKDAEMIQGVHDHAVSLGAECDRSNYKLMEERHACSCHKKDELRSATVKNEGGKWAVYTKDGSHRLGIHDTKDQALAQRLVIEERAAALSRN